MNIEKKYGANKKDLIALLILFVLFIVEVIVSIYGIIFRTDINQIITNSINILEIFAIGYYAIFAYKKFDQKAMSGLFLLYSITIAANALFREKNTTLMLFVLTVIILTSYMAGSVDKYKRNIYLGGIVFIIMFMHDICVLSMNTADNLSTTIGVFANCIFWITILYSYKLNHSLPKKE